MGWSERHNEPVKADRWDLYACVVIFVVITGLVLIDTLLPLPVPLQVSMWDNVGVDGLMEAMQSHT